ncbi:MAG: hypothetical protein OWT27_08560 [Firmicutes bacterium]|nr:hypothetical protein [Bacillota bacterium]
MVDSGQTKRPPLKPPVAEPEAVMLPKQDLQFVALPIAKDEEARREGIQCKGLLHQGRKSVDGLAHVGMAAGEIDLLGWCEVVQHPVVKISTTWRSNAGSNPGGTSIVTAPTRKVSDKSRAAGIDITSNSRKRTEAGAGTDGGKRGNRRSQ